MAIKCFVGTRDRLQDFLNGAVLLGPIPAQGAPVGGKTLTFSTPAVTVTFAGTLGSIRTAAQIIADIKLVIADMTFYTSPTGAQQLVLSMSRESAFTILSTGTANQDFGLSTSANTVSSGETGGSAIRAIETGSEPGHYLCVVDTTPNAAPADATVISDGGGSITVDTPQLPVALGRTTAGSSLSVVLASDDHMQGAAGPVALASAAEAANMLNLARYNLTPPVLTDGQVVVQQVDASGALIATSRLKGQGGALALAAAAEAVNQIPLGRYNLTPPTLTDGQVAPLQFDTNGYLRGVEQYAPAYENNVLGVAQVATLPIVTPTFAWTKYNSPSLATNHVIKAAAALVRQLEGRIDSTATVSTTYYVLLMDAAALPANGAVTIIASRKLVMPGTGVDLPWTMDFTEQGHYAGTGLVVAISTTEFTLTISASATLKVDHGQVK